MATDWRDTYDSWRTECADPWEQPCEECGCFYDYCECEEQEMTQPEHLKNAKRKPPAKLRAKVDAMCKYCIYDPIGGTGTWRQQTEACNSRGCPLWPVRPKSTTRKGGEE